MRSLVLAAVSVIALAGCHLRTDAPSEAPTNVNVRNGDGVVVVSWDTLPNLTYWIFLQEGNSVGIGTPGSLAIRRAISPRVVTNLANKHQFAFIVNATHDDSPAGPSSAPLPGNPRLAGETGSWTSGPALPPPPLPPQNLKSAAFSGSRFVVVGDAATILAGDFDYTSDYRDPTNNPPGVTKWMLPTLPTGFTADLSSVIFNGLFIALGPGSLASGSSPVITSADGITWISTSITPVPAAGMNAIAFGVAANTLVAVGDGGRIFTSTDLTKPWTERTSGTNNALNSIAVLNNKFFATGANGTLLTSLDGVAWDPPLDSKTSSTLRSVTFTALGSGAHYVAVGDGGVITTSDINGIIWTAITLPAPTPDLRSVTVGGASLTRFLAVGLGGAVAFADEDSIWHTASAGSADLTKVLAAPAMYLAVGAAGANVVSR